ncbi:unnamed protein product [Paramecium octaurelia]|uniref:Uncharacterized protein n=1 Tax=Paramecium octaurelia TaxID=43137 RepID=A0A8S1T2Y9_PAROT|nr:unnamed protein product [Paramecium octaurelia]
MADDVMDNEKKLTQLKAKLLKLKSKKEEMEEQLTQKELRNNFLEKELTQKTKDFELLGKYVTSGYHDDEYQEKKPQGQQVSKMLEKSVLEKFSYHTDKYFRYIEDCINQEQEQAEIKDDDNQYQAPPPTCAIQVKCLKSCLPKDKQEIGVPGDDPDYVTQTFRYTKLETFESLKQAALRFWGLVETKVTTNYMENNQKSNGLQSEIQQEGGEQSKVSEGNGQVAISGLNNSQSSRQSENDIKRIANRFEIVTDDLEPVQNTNLIERFLNEQIANPNKNTLCVVLRKKKNKQSHKKVGGKIQNDGKSQGMSQVKSYGVSHGGQSSQIGTQTNQQSNQQSKVAGDEQSNQQQYNQLEEDDDDDDDENDPDQDEEKRRLKIKLYKKFATFFKRFPLLRKMFMIDKKDIESRGVMIDKEIKQDKKGMTCDDNNFCVILILAALFVLNYLALYYLEDGPYAQTNYRRLQSLLKVGSIGEAGSYRDISKVEDIYNYYCNVSGIPYELMVPESNFRQSFDIIGAIRIRQIRTKPADCQYPRRNDRKSQISCVYTQVTSSSRQTDQIGDGSKQWMSYQATSELGIPRISKGTFDDYDSSGYILDLKKSDQTLLQYKNKVIQELFNHPDYLVEGLNAQILTMTVRSKNDGSFIFLEFLIEYTNSALIPNIPLIIPFNLNLAGRGLSQPYSVIAQRSLESPQNPIDFEVGLIIYLITIAKVFVGIFFLFFQLIKIKTYLTDSKVKGLKYFISITFVLNCLIIYITFKSCDLIFQQDKMNYDANELFMKEDFVDLGDLAAHHSSALFTNTIGLCFTILRIFLLFNFLRSFEAALSAIEQYYLMIFASLFILAFVLVGYTMISMSLYGQYNVAFSTFTRALTSLLLILTDCQDQYSFYQFDITLGTVFMIIFYFLFYTFMFNILAVMYIDSYRIIIVDQGELVQDSWTSDDIFKFFTTWIPDGCKKKFNKALQQVQLHTE